MTAPECANHPLFGSFSLADGFRYQPGFVAAQQAQALFDSLRAELPWGQHTVKMFGRTLLTPRLVSWHGDVGASLRYSGVRHEPHPWTAGLQYLRELLQVRLQHPFNSVLANFYRDGQDSMGWHADDERELGPEPVIASISLGGERRFDVRSRSAPTRRLRLTLEHGSLLLMQGNSQRDWLHQIAKTRQHCTPRINLTFRFVLQ